LLSFLVITLIAGGYPALLLSKLGTVQALKGKLESSGKNRLRNVLMVVQFGIAILLISGTLVVWNQLQFMRNKDLGFNKEQVISFPLNGKTENFMQLFRNELRGKPGILSVTAADDVLGLGEDGRVNTHQWGFYYEGHPVMTNHLIVDYDYVETLDLELVAGRSFSRKFATDSFAVLINEAMAKELREEKPLNAQIEDDTLYSVIGVLKNYNFQNLNKTVAPITIFLNKSPAQLEYAYVKVAPQNLGKSFDLVKNAWEKIEPNVAFRGSFLDENITRTFQREKTMATIITSGSIIAIVLSCIGLFAISLLIVAQRTKEIGIRKIVGASVSSITFLLVKDFLKLVGIAFLIAAPIAYWLLKNWLQGYAYRIDLNAWFFIIAGFLAVCIALATMSVKTIKAALQNPVKSLKTE
ncbi:MAG TPA: FtsX-like permease family protein, partial [Salinimicrobium sp.]|nr:FtsX-like permease family protein [Salinimicrobium sp.]